MSRIKGGNYVFFLTFPGFLFLQGQYSHLVLLAAFDCIDDTKLACRQRDDAQLIVVLLKSSAL